MKTRFILAVAVPTLLVGTPLAQAFQTVQSNSVPAVNAPRVADPEDILDSMDHSGSGNGSIPTPLGNSLRFGTPTTGGGSSDSSGPRGASPFLESPASRTVPSQAR